MNRLRLNLCILPCIEMLPEKCKVITYNMQDKLRVGLNQMLFVGFIMGFFFIHSLIFYVNVVNV